MIMLRTAAEPAGRDEPARLQVQTAQWHRQDCRVAATQRQGRSILRLYLFCPLHDDRLIQHKTRKSFTFPKQIRIPQANQCKPCRMKRWVQASAPNYFKSHACCLPPVCTPSAGQTNPCLLLQAFCPLLRFLSVSLCTLCKAIPFAMPHCRQAAPPVKWVKPKAKHLLPRNRCHQASLSLTLRGQAGMILLTCRVEVEVAVATSQMRTTLLTPPLAI